MEDVYGVDEVVGGAVGQICEPHGLLHCGADAQGFVERPHREHFLGQLSCSSGKSLGRGDVPCERFGWVGTAQQADVLEGVVVPAEVSTEDEQTFGDGGVVGHRLGVRSAHAWATWATAWWT
ncbi:hypothetical protein [Streptomyces decoyicus]|uniref:hypothetical protein n=1 Tax=Streptomyces decoyicus TaxID=249567 RepID=UPI00386B7621